MGLLCCSASVWRMYDGERVVGDLGRYAAGAGASELGELGGYVCACSPT